MALQDSRLSSLPVTHKCPWVAKTFLNELDFPLISQIMFWPAIFLFLCEPHYSLQGLELKLLELSVLG